MANLETNRNPPRYQQLYGKLIGGLKLSSTPTNQRQTAELERSHALKDQSFTKTFAMPPLLRGTSCKYSSFIRIKTSFPPERNKGEVVHTLDDGGWRHVGLLVNRKVYISGSLIAHS